MRAARFYDEGDIRVEQIAEPTAQSDQVLVEVEWSGICGSDLHEFVADTPHALTGDVLPCVMGHEFCGRIQSCPEDSGLQKGIDHCCQKLGFLGVSGRGGGFSELVAVDRRMLHVLPNNVPLSAAALIEPVATAHHAVKATRIADWADKNVLIIGGGPVGVTILLALRAQGVKRIIVSEPTLARRELLSGLADLVINPFEEDVPKVCQDHTGGVGPDVVYDCAGIPQSIETAFKAFRVGGTHVNIAIWEKPMAVPMWDFLSKDITILSAMAYNDQDFSEVVQMLAEGKFHGYEKLVSTRISLEDLVEKGFKELVHNKDAHLKILVTPKQDTLRA
ncbi:chaperonin 10-like protein [Exophiala viscosa]|uniref:Chaperonin 10-like protein n=1 Tax=Exophiala viscosa TaxID=2486360 RepID=A0AAN6E2L5_9EURO|nr:chaperonin 10-like protein [Exophiala viscosa]